MLDKISKQFLKDMQSKPDKKLFFTGDITPPAGIKTTSDFYSLIQYLVDHGELEYIVDSLGDPIGARLTHKARNTKSFTWLAVLQYIIRNLIAIIALGVSIWAVIRTYQ